MLRRWIVFPSAGLDYLHTRPDPVIHRDLKCDNIFINGALAACRWVVEIFFYCTSQRVFLMMMMMMMMMCCRIVPSRSFECLRKPRRHRNWRFGPLHYAQGIVCQALEQRKCWPTATVSEDELWPKLETLVKLSNSKLINIDGLKVKKSRDTGSFLSVI